MNLFFKAHAWLLRTKDTQFYVYKNEPGIHGVFKLG